MRRPGSERALHHATAATPDAALRIEFEAVADALRQGSRAMVQELALIKRRWTFPLSEVSTPVYLWHGALDRNVPIAFARRLTRELPDATLHVSESSGHDVGLDRSAEVDAVPDHAAQTILAYDSFTVDTVLLKRVERAPTRGNYFKG